jgi:3-hydroxyisobutyrate dehydrogenase-like beta-hydroxyacid dehydrogenase
MGISVAASAQKSGYPVYWASKGRSKQTRERAEKYKLSNAHTLWELCDTCSTILCVCPPDGAEKVGDRVLECGFTGLYVDANAISPERALRIGEKMSAAGVTFVDGSIIGGPAWEPGTTLYLSGEAAEEVVPYFSAGPLGTRVIGEEVGKASAIKMVYAAYTKGTTALLCAILATAEALGVRGELETRWAEDWDGFDEQATRRVLRVTSKAWRFAGEMDEIAATFSDAGVPGGFHEAAAVLYKRIAGFKDSPSTPDLGEVLAALIEEDGEHAVWGKPGDEGI